MPSQPLDIAILGGGLAGGLIALALARLRPELRLAVIERGPTFGGNHVWSCFASDVAEADRWLVDPLVEAEWPQYEVRFPGYARQLVTPYRSLNSERLDAALREALPPEALLCDTDVVSATQTSVSLMGGREIAAKAVIDARGARTMPGMAGGWQKFVGQMLRLPAPHGLTHPVVMDATVEQIDGYRFVYCLPFGVHEVFVEDTYYSDTSDLDVPQLRARIAAYAQAQGWQGAEVLREETGVLPVIAAGDFAAFWPKDAGETARAGVRAALVHPLTSYSLPDAVRLARHIAAQPDLSGAALARETRRHAAAHWRSQGFYRMLSRMLFGAAGPSERRSVLDRFYTLPAGLIERFYAGRSTRADTIRVLTGKPPVPIFAALASLSGRGRPLASLGEAA